MMEDGRKRQPAHDISGEYSLKKKARSSPATSDDGSIGDGEGSGEGEDIFACLTVMDDEETVGELMKLLEEKDVMTTSNVFAAAAKVKFIDDPYSTPSVFQSSSSYVTINGNEESCGSSFSDSDSSVMVSIDVGGVFINNVGGGGRGGRRSEAFGSVWGFQALDHNGGVCGEEEEEVARYFVTEKEYGEKSVSGMNGCDGLDLEDVLLARFLGEDLF